MIIVFDHMIADMLSNNGNSYKKRKDSLET